MATKWIARVEGLHPPYDGEYQEVDDYPVPYNTAEGEKRHKASLCLADPRGQRLCHVYGGLYGIFIDGEIRARQLGPEGRWAIELKSGQYVIRSGGRVTLSQKRLAEATDVTVPLAQEAEPEKKDKNGLRYSCDPAEVRGLYDTYCQARTAKGLPVPTLDPRKHSDLAVFKEVIIGRTYQEFKGQRSLQHFLARKDDVLLDLGANIGLATWFYATDIGLRKADVYEPSKGCMATLEENLRKLNNFRGAFKLHKAAVSSKAGEVVFLDNTDCSRGGSSRSLVKDVATQSRLNLKGQKEYKVPQLAFDQALQDHTIVKMDCEGSEVPILLAKWDWKKVRILVVEISVLKIRKEHPMGDGWKVLADIFDNLSQAGFRFAKVQKRFFELGYWKPDTAIRHHMSDGIIWFARPAKNVQISDYQEWLSFRSMMKAGGCKPEASDAKNAANAASGEISPSNEASEPQRMDDMTLSSLVGAKPPKPTKPKSTKSKKTSGPAKAKRSERKEPKQVIEQKDEVPASVIDEMTEPLAIRHRFTEAMVTVYDRLAAGPVKLELQGFMCLKLNGVYATNHFVSKCGHPTFRQDAENPHFLCRSNTGGWVISSLKGDARSGKVLSHPLAIYNRGHWIEMFNGKLQVTRAVEARVQGPDGVWPKWDLRLRQLSTNYYIHFKVGEERLRPTF